MKKTITSAALAALLLAACGSDDDDDGTPAPTLDTAAAIDTYLAGKTWVMTGADIPTHPNGLNEDQNWGAATQCYNRVTLAMAAGEWTVTSALGTLTGAPNQLDVGDCNRGVVLTTLPPFISQTVLVENVEGNGACFDLVVDYGAFAQEGRAKFSADGRTLTLELFFEDAAVGANCAAGDVGSGGITLGGVAFAGNAQQVYRLQ
jgi:hypothetical protein